MIIEIKITGPKESGKTSIAKIISDALDKAGIACETIDGEAGDEWKHFQADRLASLKKKGDLLVKIKTEETRSYKNGENG